MAPEADQERPPKRVKLLSADELDSSSSDSSGGVPLKINKEYARRFEHNSRRAELHRLEEKYGKKVAEAKAQNGPDGNEDSDDSSSTSTDEDDEGVLASAALDEEFNATLQAIRNKDPRVYDANATFYADVDEDHRSDVPKKEKPMYLQDYHRENILRGGAAAEIAEPKPTYVQEQEQLKQAVLKEMHDAATRIDTDNDDDDNFLVAKEKPVRGDDEPTKTPVITATEVENANADPDAFLTKFMASRAWANSDGSALHPFESDDEEEEERAEAIEEAFNFRFEDPSKANEKLVSHARDAIEKYTVRQEAPSKRQRAREAEKERKQAEKQERKLEKTRLRKLRIDEAQTKLARIKDAAGSKSHDLKLDEWQDLLAGDWDEDQWEAQMQEKFNDAYYAERSESEDEEGTAKRKKPKWGEEIEVTDLVPEFDDGNEAEFSLSSEESAGNEEIAAEPPKKQKKDKLAAKAEKRKERRQLEQLVDAQLDLDMALRGPGPDHKGRGFQYRDTSPTAFGMSAQDILFADDKQLNQYAGLKKLAAFRDPEKKRRDKKRLGKKARLREWRKDTFGHERGSRKSLQEVIREQLAAGPTGGEDKAGRMLPGKTRKRSKASAAP